MPIVVETDVFNASRSKSYPISHDGPGDISDAPQRLFADNGETPVGFPVSTGNVSPIKCAWPSDCIEVAVGISCRLSSEQTVGYTVGKDDDWLS